MHKALYRIYRPRNFDEILGQDAIVSVLKNQLEEGNLSHAYLFCGPRGTGKTSTAKVLAKAVNCTEEHSPCYKCKTCLESDMDVLELDAASNNSVDDIREIRENVVFTPVVGRYKVYIIDEVHMLSAGAANALLKTLEEPPEHVIFILATTEPQKIPATVLSRCQRFDFKQVEEGTMVGLLRDILTKENRTWEEEVLSFIAQKSGGAVRDALSLLDKAISYGELTLDNALEALGDVEEQVYAELLKACASKEIPKILQLLNHVQEKGVDAKAFVRQLILYMKEDLMNLVASKGGNAREARSKNTAMTGDELGQWMEDFCSISNELRFASMPQAQLEIQVMRLIHMGGLTHEKAEIRALKNQMLQMKKQMDLMSNMLQKTDLSGVQIGKVAWEVEDSRRESPASFEYGEGRTGSLSLTEKFREEKAGKNLSKMEDRKNNTGKREGDFPGLLQEDLEEKSQKGFKPIEKKGIEEKEREISAGDLEENTDGKKSVLVFTAEELQGRLPEVLEELKNRRQASTGALLRVGRVCEVQENFLVMAFPGKESFHRVQLSQRVPGEEARQAWEAVLGQEVHLRFIDEEDLVVPYRPEEDPTLALFRREFPDAEIRLVDFE